MHSSCENRGYNRTGYKGWLKSIDIFCSSPTARNVKGEDGEVGGECSEQEKKELIDFVDGMILCRRVEGLC